MLRVSCLLCESRTKCSTQFLLVVARVQVTKLNCLPGVAHLRGVSGCGRECHQTWGNCFQPRTPSAFSSIRVPHGTEAPPPWKHGRRGPAKFFKANASRFKSEVRRSPLRPRKVCVAVRSVGVVTAAVCRPRVPFARIILCSDGGPLTDTLPLSECAGPPRGSAVCAKQRGEARSRPGFESITSGPKSSQLPWRPALGAQWGVPRTTCLRNKLTVFT